MPHLIRRALPLLITALLMLAAPAFAQEQTHVVQPGENLFRIALRYGLSTSELAAANNISNAGQIFSGQVLTIPLPGSAPAAPAPAEAAPVTTTSHTITAGDTLQSIARTYGMTVEQLASLNNILNPNLIYRGQVLTVNASAPAVEVAAAPAPAAPVEQTVHVVQPGEYLSSIAARYGVSWLAIAQANNLATPDRVLVGTRLVIPAAGAAPILDGGVQSVPAAPAAPIGAGREILVDLSDSRIYAYENGVLLRNVLGSMGRSATPTVIGSFTVQRRYVAGDMSGPGYYLPQVPYILYFYQGYAIHGTYWHSNWGTPMSHGCVNLPTPEAEWFFNFASIGTPVTVQA